MNIAVKSMSEIKKARVYSDIFSEDKEEAKKEYRSYCKLYHPDVNKSVGGAELFDIITTLYRKESISKLATDSDSIDYTFINKTTGKGFILTKPIVINTGMCLAYHTDTKVALVYDKSYSKFFDRYLKNVKELTYVDKAMQDEFGRYFPKVLTSFKTADKQCVILLNKTSDVVNLGRIVQAYEKDKVEFPIKQAAWIISRLYNIICYFNYYKKVSNGISLNNIWVSPEMHTVLMFGGWEYQVGFGEDMVGCPKEVYNILPVICKSTHEANTVADLESIKAVGRKLFGENANTPNINKFLNTGVTGNDPFIEWDNYSKSMLADFGKRKFTVWEDVKY